MFNPRASKRTDSPKVEPRNGVPKWAPYRPKHPLKCDDCMAILHESAGKAPMAQAGRFKRTVNGEFRLLCGPHAQQWRVRDKLPKLRGC